MVSDDGSEDDDDSFLQMPSEDEKVELVDGIGLDWGEVNPGESNEPDVPSDDANFVSADGSDDAKDSFVQTASTVKKGDGFDGFGAPDPFNQNDDDQVDAGEPNAPDAENPNEDANMVSDDGSDEDDDAFVQVATRNAQKFLAKLDKLA